MNLNFIIEWVLREPSLRKRAIRSLQLKEGDTVLDLACGNGVCFEPLERSIGCKGKIIAFDHDEQTLDLARKWAESKDWTNIQFILGDAAYMNLPDSSLDGALCTFGLSAIPDHETAIRNVFKVLKTGKRFVILDDKLFEGIGRLFNPLARRIFTWDYQKDIMSAVREAFEQVYVQKFSSGADYIIIATKKE